MPSSSEPSTRPVAPSLTNPPTGDAPNRPWPELGPGVTLVRWPAEAAVRSGLAALGQPRLLLLDVGVAPPAPLDDLEDWVHWPPAPEELAARAANLRGRMTREAEPPILDGDGLLRRGDRWVAISDVQIPMIQHLLDHLGRVVRYSTIVEAYVAGGGTNRAASVRTVLSRLDGRVRPVGLEIVTIRRRGVMLRTIGPGPSALALRSMAPERGSPVSNNQRSTTSDNDGQSRAHGA